MANSEAKANEWNAKFWKAVDERSELRRAYDKAEKRAQYCFEKRQYWADKSRSKEKEKQSGMTTFWHQTHDPQEE